MDISDAHNDPARIRWGVDSRESSYFFNPESNFPTFFTFTGSTTLHPFRLITGLGITFTVLLCDNSRVVTTHTTDLVFFTHDR